MGDTIAEIDSIADKIAKIFAFFAPFIPELAPYVPVVTAAVATADAANAAHQAGATPADAVATGVEVITPVLASYLDDQSKGGF